MANINQVVLVVLDSVGIGDAPDAALYGDAILTQSSKQQMWTPVKLSNGKTHGYGFGWAVDEIQGHRRISHNGGRSGTSTTICRFVDDKLTVIVLTNRDDVDTEKIASYVAGFYIPALARPIYYAIRDTDPPTMKQVKSIVDGFAQGKQDTELFPPGIGINVSGFRSPVNNGTDLSNTLHDLGPVQSITLVERQEEGENRFRRYRVLYRNTSLLAGFTFNKEHKITLIQFLRE